jgi:hypothetical protein
VHVLQSDNIRAPTVQPGAWRGGSQAYEKSPPSASGHQPPQDEDGDGTHIALDWAWASRSTGAGSCEASMGTAAASSAQSPSTARMEQAILAQGHSTFPHQHDRILWLGHSQTAGLPGQQV